MTEVGARVWCVRNADDTTVYAFGFGTYEGDHLLPGEPSEWLLALAEKTVREGDDDPRLIDPSIYYGAKVVAGELSQADADVRIAEASERERAWQARPVADRARDLAEGMARNPRIRLDGGGTVWGCQCWWGKADDASVDRFAKGRTVVIVSPKEAVA